MAITISVNRTEHSVDVDDDTPLLWVLRDTLDMRGTKFGCGRGFCGACTVHFDGVATRSCQTPVAGAVGHAITTIEGLGAGALHPLQQAWIDEDVPQCGYCQAGQLMTAAALLAKTPHPTDGEIVAALAGNLCRCATYVRIRRAVRRASNAMAGRTP